MLIIQVLSLGLIKGLLFVTIFVKQPLGIIDEIDQAVYISWMQPHILSISRIGCISTRLNEWNKRTKSFLNFLENQTTSELVL